MAKSTKVIHKMENDPNARHEQEIKELEQQLLAHKESLNELLSILDKLNDQEILNILNAGLGQSDQITQRIITAVKDTDASKSIKNMLLIFQLLAALDMEQLEPLIIKFKKGVEKAGKYEHGGERGGYASLLSALKDPEVIEGTNIMLRIVQGLGTNVSGEKKTESQLEQYADRERQLQKEERRVSRTSPKWYIFIGGAVVALVPFMFKKK
ncbi:DUF1641 domain-containing protein [Salinicoccus albus]|uniref:DUF1641 domain-containing protein n=1 Tax=Salinicoccus albus TaxID=418756 RepID=UPI0003755C31|nr:DUF1641 domain-containing protein [Salinicoccus albus]